MEYKKENVCKKMYIGLGNPGLKYEKSRHNIGYMFIDFLFEKFKNENEIVGKKFKNSMVYQMNKSIILVKPSTFMNNSGRAVREVVKWFGVDIESELTIIHDDLDIPFGRYKYHFARSPREHNGVKSVEDNIGTCNFYRLRIGIDNRASRNIPGSKYVLQKFSSSEKKELGNIFESIFSELCK